MVIQPVKVRRPRPAIADVIQQLEYVAISPRMAAVFVAKAPNKNAARAYALRAVMGAMSTLTGYKLFYTTEIIELLTLTIGCHPEHARVLIRSTVELGLLEYSSDKKWLYLVGKKVTYDRYLENKAPGKLVHVELRKLLNPSLQVVRATLYYSFAAKPRTISRLVQAKLTGYTEQTTRNWNFVVRHEVIRITQHYTTIYMGQQVIIKRAPNLYKSLMHKFVYTDNPQQAWDEDCQTRGYVPTDIEQLKNCRRYYDDVDYATQNYQHRLKKASHDPHFQVIDTYYDDPCNINGRKINGLARVRPYDATEIPLDLRIAIEESVEREAIQWANAQDKQQSHIREKIANARASKARIKQDRLDDVGMKMYDLTHTKLSKPHKHYPKSTQFHHNPYEHLTEVQRIELLLNPELELLLA